jgi:hypothetical protein
MKYVFTSLLVLIGFTSFLFADDSGLADLIYTESTHEVNSANTYKVEKYKKYAKRIKVNNSVVKDAPVEVQKALKEYGVLEQQLKKVYLDMSSAYEKNDDLKISKLNFLSWKIKEKMKIVNEKKAFAYQINEFQMALNEFPDSENMKKLIKDATKEANQYISISNDILMLKSKQKMIKSGLDRKQGEAQIIRQKEVLEQMQNVYNKKYGN